MTGIIYGKTFERAENKLKKLVSDYGLYKNVGIKIQEHTRDRWAIELSNGDIWQALRYTEATTCGRRANIVYIDHELADSDAAFNARCVACAPPFQAYSYF
jgi:hypothetical protein